MASVRMIGNYGSVYNMEIRDDENDGEFVHYNSRTKSIGHDWHDEDRKYHRDGAPAKTINWFTCKIAEEYWYIHGVLHRDDGPAIVKYDTDGTLMEERWYIHGIHITNPEWLAETNISAPYTDEDLLAITLRWG